MRSPIKMRDLARNAIAVLLPALAALGLLAAPAASAASGGTGAGEAAPATPPATPAPPVAPAPVPSVEPVTITLEPAAAGRPVPARFLGLSFEVGSLALLG